tara:strand:- start:1183 stop:1383 length:201 start_codon:yes stop_codon:yes gene_type:complete
LLKNQGRRTFELVNIAHNQMYTLDINLMDMSISLDAHFLQFHSYLILPDMFVEKKEKLNLVKILNK